MLSAVGEHGGVLPLWSIVQSGGHWFALASGVINKTARFTSTHLIMLARLGIKAISKRVWGCEEIVGKRYCQMSSREALGYLTARVWLGRHLTSPRLSSGLWNGCSCASSGWKLVRHGTRNTLCAGHRGVDRGVSYSGEKRGYL